MKIVVIGGGASGMAAAISAAEKGAEVVLFEKEERLGRKLLATGNGRCNYSNEIYDGTEYHSSDDFFVKSVLSNVTPKDTLSFFQRLGIFPRVESEGRIYPSSEQAASVLDALRMEVERLNVEVVCEHWIKGLVAVPSGGFNLVSHQNRRLHADKVIIACGGRAGGQYGCTGDGYYLAESLGHTFVEPKPALVQLTAEGDFFKQLKGVRAKGKVSLVSNAEVVKEESGEIQFTEHGLSGICIFNLSGETMRRRAAGEKCSIRMDLFPQMEWPAFQDMMRERLAQSGHKTVEDFLNGLINKKLIVVVLKQCGITKMNMPASDLTAQHCDKIASLLKGWTVAVTGARPWNEAQTTTGGITLSEIDPETLESRVRQGLYFAGEVVDVDGKCGGYNLQWAWSSGILAGRSAAEA